MVMEFWCGWFNRWGEPIVTRETDELVDSLREAIQLGSVSCTCSTEGQTSSLRMVVLLAAHITYTKSLLTITEHH